MERTFDFSEYPISKESTSSNDYQNKEPQNKIEDLFFDFEEEDSFRLEHVLAAQSITEIDSGNESQEEEKLR